MGEKLVIGPINNGLQTNREPFFINNDSFPNLINAYQWRGRIKRKRGTSLLNRLQRTLVSVTSPNGGNQVGIIGTDDGSGNFSGNLITTFSLGATASIVRNASVLTDGINIFTDTGNGLFLGFPSGAGTINYATGAITITGGAANAPLTGTFAYYPGLPVMDLEDLNLQSLQFPGTIAFDTKYAYNILNTNPYTIYDVSFYKNPPSGTYPGYVAKANKTPLTWHGQNYQQFWSANFENAMWVTNGIASPLDLSATGMQFKKIENITNVVVGPPAFANITITNHGLIIGDFLFINEVQGTLGPFINFQTGYVTAVVSPNIVTVEFPNATFTASGYTPNSGIAQYLTNTAIPTVDSIRWYDGDPTNTAKGWVNFSPPISQGDFSISDLPPAQYYLVGCVALIPFKDRILFIGAVVQSSTTGPFYLQNAVVFSQNGTPYYTASFTAKNANSVVLANTVYTPILVPDNQTATPNSYFEDVAGFGGSTPTGYMEPLLTVGANQDVLIMGDTKRQFKLVYTGNDLLPFTFYVVNSELGSGSTFSTVVMDRGVHTTGEHGIIITSQVGAQRIDLNIPDNVFEFRLIDNGPQRITAQRDYINEWIYFTYCSNEFASLFPNQTLLYNYREETWGVFDESYTTYGQFRRQTGQTWATLPKDLTWATWDKPWNTGSSTLLQPQIIAGNQQGFVMIREDDTNEGTSLFISNIVGQTITSPNHGLNNGDFVLISGVLGTVAPFVNGIPFKIAVGNDLNTFLIIPLNPINPALTYLGGGLITRMYVPLIQTMQFPVSWSTGRKTRIGPQMYLLTNSATEATPSPQIELQIYLSMDAANAYNAGNIVPGSNVDNNALIYSDVLYTCPESTNLGLTPANTNLQMVTASAQEQIWHRMNTSLLGDTVQIGFTISDQQMLDTTLGNQFAEVELHSIILDVTPSMVLA